MNVNDGFDELKALSTGLQRREPGIIVLFFSEDLSMRTLWLLAILMLCIVATGFGDVPWPRPGQDVTTPGDPVIGQPDNNRWPSGEAPQHAIDDNVSTKYLHFRDGQVAGIIISPQLGTGQSQPTLVQGITLTSANDASDRDPHSYELYGSNAGVNGPWTLISEGPVLDFIGGWPRLTKIETPIIFDNQTEYLHYRLMFPTLGGSSMFQIAEIELVAPPENGWPAAVMISPAAVVVDAADPTVEISVEIDDFDSTSWDVLWTQVSGPTAVDLDNVQDQTAVELTLPAVRGTYVLRALVTDSEGNESNPVETTVRVWDAELDNKLVGYWTFNEGEGTFIDDSSDDVNRGFMGNYHNDPDLDPNFVEGWIPADGQNNYALHFQDFGYVQVIPDANSVSDPNLQNLDYGISVAAWVNAYDWDGNRRIAQFGNDSNDDVNIFRLLRENSSLRFIASPFRDRMLDVPLFPAEQWHHVVATYDGKTIKMYVDGVLAGVQEFDTYRALHPYEGQTLYIGAKNKNVNPDSYPGDYMFGSLDDLRVYSYAIDEATVRSLVQMGLNSAPVVVGVDAPESIILKGETTVVFSADVFDAHDDEILYQWLQTYPDPEEGPAAAFSATDVAAPEVTFTQPGDYTFRLLVSDGMYGIEEDIYYDVTIEVIEASCDLVKADGLLLAGDLNEDCRVDILDLVILAQDWLRCNDPADPTCEDPYAQW